MDTTKTSLDATLIFLDELQIHEIEKPYEIWCQSDPEYPKSNCTFKEHDGIKIRDMRQSDQEFGYDTCGFRYAIWPSTVGLTGAHCTSTTDSQEILEYLEETVSFVKQEFRVQDVICFDWRVSRSFKTQ
jgi:hypothetical protein